MINEKLTAAFNADRTIRASTRGGQGPVVLITARSISHMLGLHEVVRSRLPAAWIEHVFVTRNLASVRAQRLPFQLAPLQAQRSVLALAPIHDDSQVEHGWDLIVSGDTLSHEEREVLRACLRAGRPEEALIEAPISAMSWRERVAEYSVPILFVLGLLLWIAATLAR